MSFESSYGTPQREEAVDFISKRVSNSIYILAIYNQAPQEDFAFLNLNGLGILQWQQVYGRANGDIPSSIGLLDGEILITGYLQGPRIGGEI